jgi:transposase-like protein
VHGRAFDETMTVMELPLRYRLRLKSTNMQERLNEEIRRPERAHRINRSRNRGSRSHAEVDGLPTTGHFVESASFP